MSPRTKPEPQEPAAWKGHEGEIREVKAELKALGFYGGDPADTRDGAAFDAAVKKFQKFAGMPAEHGLDKNTRDVIFDVYDRARKLGEFKAVGGTTPPDDPNDKAYWDSGRNATTRIVERLGYDIDEAKLPHPVITPAEAAAIDKENTAYRAAHKSDIRSQDSMFKPISYGSDDVSPAQTPQTHRTKHRAKAAAH